MKLNPMAVVATVVAGLVAAAPAGAADPDIFGTYSFTADNGESATWLLSPCADSPPGCARVAASGNAMRAPWTAEAHFSVGSWILLVQQPDAIRCEDGTTVPGMNTYSWDAASLAGNASILTRGACGATTANLSIPFRLARLGAAETPPAAASPQTPGPAMTAPQDQTPTPMPPAPSTPLAAESTATGATAPEPAPSSAPAPAG
jgi:hypothetical protein